MKPFQIIQGLKNVRRGFHRQSYGKHHLLAVASIHHDVDAEYSPLEKRSRIDAIWYLLRSKSASSESPPPSHLDPTYVERYKVLTQRDLRVILRGLLEGEEKDFSSVDGTIGYLKSRGWFPDSVGPPQDLVNYRGLTRETSPLKFRERTESMFRRVSAGRLKKREQRFRDCHRHVLCMSGPGTGKSHMVDRGLETLKSIPADAVGEYADLRRLALESSVAVHITFSSDSETMFCEVDAKIGAQVAVATRILTSYFGINEHLLDLQNTPGIDDLSMGTAVGVVLSHYRGLRSRVRAQARASSGVVVDGTGIDNEDVLVYLGIDDVSSILPLGSQTSVVSDWDAAKGQFFLKQMFNALFQMYLCWSHEKYFLACIVSSSIYDPVADLISPQFFDNLPMPLLPMNDSVDLAVRALEREAAQGKSVRAYRNGNICVPFKMLLADIGGIPRYVWMAIELVISHDPSPTDDTAWKAIRESVKSNMRSYYMLEDLSVVKEALHWALLRQDISPYMRLSNGQTLQDIENQGRLFLSASPHKGGNYVVQIPLIHLECYLEDNNQLLKMIDKLVDQKSWTDWEELCIVHEALRLDYVRYSRYEVISVQDYYRGAIVGSKVADVELSIPDTSNGLPIVVSRLSARYPEDAEARLDPLLSPSDSRLYTVFKNAKGAKIGALVFHEGSAKTKYRVRCLHFKHTDLTLSDISRDKKAARKALKEASAERPELRGCYSIHVFISDGSWRTRADREHMPRDVVVITKDELRAYFGLTFADRMELMMRVAKAASEGKDTYWVE